MSTRPESESEGVSIKQMLLSIVLIVFVLMAGLSYLDGHQNDQIIISQ